MYLHVGKGKSVKEDDVIGIFDLDTSTVSSVTKKFINKMQKNGNLEYTDSDLPRSFILTEKKGNIKIVLSRISTIGLKSRSDIEWK